MNENYPPFKLESDKTSSARGLTTLHVCTSCRPTNCPREPRENCPGHLLYKELSTKLLDSALKDIVNVAPARCLACAQDLAVSPFPHQVRGAIFSGTNDQVRRHLILLNVWKLRRNSKWGYRDDAGPKRCKPAF